MLYYKRMHEKYICDLGPCDFFLAKGKLKILNVNVKKENVRCLFSLFFLITYQFLSNSGYKLEISSLIVLLLISHLEFCLKKKDCAN